MRNRKPFLRPLLILVLLLSAMPLAAEGQEAEPAAPTATEGRDATRALADAPAIRRVSSADSLYELRTRSGRRLPVVEPFGGDRFLISLPTDGCGGPFVLERGSSAGRCLDELVDGKGFTCDTIEKGLEALLNDLDNQCKAECAQQQCGRNDRCGSVGHDFLGNPKKQEDRDTCRPLRSVDCPDKTGFVCEKPDVTCTCICVNA